MAESFVQVNTATLPGKKMATFEYVNGAAEVVESEAVTLVDSDGNEIDVAREATVAVIAAAAVSIDSKLPPPASTATLTAIPGNLVAVPFLADDPTRLGFSIYNQSLTDVLFLLLAPGLVSTSFFTVPLQPNAYYEDPFRYTGEVSGIWGSVAPGAQALVNVYKP